MDAVRGKEKQGDREEFTKNERSPPWRGMGE